MPLGAFVAIMSFGIVSGLVFEIGFVARYFLRMRLFFTIVIDLVVSVVAGGLFVWALFKFCDFDLSVYACVAFVVGFVLERTTLGILLAKDIQIVYNWLVSLKIRLESTKFGKRIFK